MITRRIGLLILALSLTVQGCTAPMYVSRRTHYVCLMDGGRQQFGEFYSVRLLVTTLRLDAHRFLPIKIPSGLCSFYEYPRP